MSPNAPFAHSSQVLLGILNIRFKIFHLYLPDLDSVMPIGISIDHAINTCTAARLTT